MKPSKETIIKRIIYDHPIYNLKTFKTQKKIKLIQGKNNIWYCGLTLGMVFMRMGLNLV